eukprot:jgi/Ulvmu1/3202/UM015_0243.1
MATILKELKGDVQYRDRRFEGTDEEYYRALDRSSTVYVGNLAFTTREEQLYEVFSKVGPVDRVLMGLNQQTKRPCGFAFVIYHSHKAAQSAVSYISGTKVDNRYIRVDMDWGFQEGRQYGRGKTGGQVRDEFRQDFDAGRVDPMLDIYSEGMGPQGGFRVGGKRNRYSEHAHGSNKRAAVEHDTHVLPEDNFAAPPAPAPPPPPEDENQDPDVAHMADEPVTTPSDAMDTGGGGIQEAGAKGT